MRSTYESLLVTSPNKSHRILTDIDVSRVLWIPCQIDINVSRVTMRPNRIQSDRGRWLAKSSRNSNDRFWFCVKSQIRQVNLPLIGSFAVFTADYRTVIGFCDERAATVSRTDCLVYEHHGSSAVNLRIFRWSCWLQLFWQMRISGR